MEWNEEEMREEKEEKRKHTQTTTSPSKSVETNMILYRIKITKCFAYFKDSVNEKKAQSSEIVLYIK